MSDVCCRATLARRHALSTIVVFWILAFEFFLLINFGGDELTNAGTSFDLSTGQLAVRRMQKAFDLSISQLEVVIASSELVA